jgi:hypothetical protein
MLPSPAEVEAARRVIKAIEHGGNPSQADALMLRLWIGPHTRMLPLEEIAKDIIKQASAPPVTDNPHLKK